MKTARRHCWNQHMPPEAHLFLHVAVDINDRPFRGNQMRLDGVVISVGCTLSQCNSNASTAVTVRDSLMTLSIWSQEIADQPMTLNFRATIFGKPLSQVGPPFQVLLHSPCKQKVMGMIAFVSSSVSLIVRSTTEQSECNIQSSKSWQNLSSCLIQQR